MQFRNYEIHPRGYWKPTPKPFRIAGDVLLTVGSIVTTVAAFTNQNPYVVAGAAILTALGKLATNMAKEMEKPKEQA